MRQRREVRENEQNLRRCRCRAAEEVGACCGLCALPAVSDVAEVKR
ncbi:MAG: hypothetical protein ACKERG_00505 [Candidatus Hodgkinia cicadicola]